MTEEPRRDVLDVSGPTGNGDAPRASAGGAAGGLGEAEIARLTDAIIVALKSVHDPEIPVNIYDLGLIYRAEVSDDRDVMIDMTLTAPGCPVAGEMPGWVEEAVSNVDGVRGVTVNMVFDPPWDMSRMTDEARLELGMF